MTVRNLEETDQMRRSTRLVAGLTTGLALVAMLAPAAARAHAELESTDPIADSTLERPPDEVVLAFSGELSPDGSGFVVTDASGGILGEGALDLAVADRSEIRGTVTITAPGTYTVTWSSAALDGHETRGEFAFSVATVVDPGAAPPDTALALPDAGPTRVWGALLVLAAVTIGARRLARARS